MPAHQRPSSWPIIAICFASALNLAAAKAHDAPSSQAKQSVSSRPSQLSKPSQSRSAEPPAATTPQDSTTKEKAASEETELSAAEPIAISAEPSAETSSVPDDSAFPMGDDDEREPTLEALVPPDGKTLPEAAVFPLTGPVRYSAMQRERLAEMLVRSTLVSLGLKLPEGGVAPDRALLAAVPTHLPALGPITSSFGSRRSPFTGRVVMHKGLDIGVRSGSPVYAAADGVVTQAGWKGPLGKLVTINHGFGLVTKYAHTSSVEVKKGDFVQRGQVIARAGSTGRSTGVHVHFEVRVAGKPVDPRWFLLDASEAIEPEVMLGPGAMLANADVTPINQHGVALAAARTEASVLQQTRIEAAPKVAGYAPNVLALNMLPQEEASAHSSLQDAMGIGGDGEDEVDAPELERHQLASYDAVGKLPANLAIVGGFAALCLVCTSHVLGAPTTPLTRRRRRQRREA